MTLADVLIVVAASALAMSLSRATAMSTGGGYLRIVPAPHSHWTGPLGFKLPYTYYFALYNGVPQLLVAALCVVTLSVMPRRSPVPRLARRTGCLLCLAAFTAAALTTVVNRSALHWNGYDLAPWRLVVGKIVPISGYTVLGSWIALAIFGRAVPAPSLLDRIGFALAASFVALLALEFVRGVLEGARMM